MNYNKVILAGHIVRDPETRFTSGNSIVTSWTIATSRKWKSADNLQREETAFVDCEAWGQRGEFVVNHFVKGQAMLVEGRLKQDNWEDKDGNKRSKLKIAVEDVKFVGGGNGQNRNQGNSQPRQPNNRRDEFGIDIPF